MYKFTLALIILFFVINSNTYCQDNIPQSTEKQKKAAVKPLWMTVRVPIPEVEAFVDSVDKWKAENKLKKIPFPDMSPCGGNLIGYYHNTWALVLMVAEYQAEELAFSSRTYYIRRTQPEKIIYREHAAEWDKYEKKYSFNKKFDPTKMTYTDTVYSMILTDPVMFHKETNNKIIESEADYKLINELVDCGFKMRSQLAKTVEELEKRDENGKTALIIAAEKGDTKTMQKLITRGANIEAIDHKAQNALYHACLNGQLDAVELLLANRATPKSKARWAKLAIFPAAENGHTDIVKRLAEAGYDLKVQSDQTTPLLSAIKNGHYETAKYLLEQGAANYFHYSYSPPLNLAASIGNIQMLELFLDDIKGNKNREKQFIEDALLHASNNGQLVAVERLLATDVEMSPAQNCLQGAVLSRQVESAKFWLDRGADVNAFYKDQWRAYSDYNLLMLAATYGYTDMVKLLVERGANINSETIGFSASSGDSEMIEFLLANSTETVPYLLIPAAENLKTDNVRTLLSHGFKADSRNRLKRTPMMEAALYEYDEMSGELSFPEISERVYEISKLLIENGANVNAKDYEGMTALMFAVNGGYTETVKLLLSKGARLKDSNKFGDKVTDFFNSYINPYGIDTILLDILKIKYTRNDIENGFIPNQAKLKRKNQSEKNEDFRKAILADNQEEIKRAWVNGADIAYYNNYAEETPIGEALEYGRSVATLRLLIEYGAPVNATNGSGTTPLMRAVMANDHSAVEYFIKRGADVNQKNVYANSALIFAARNGDVRMIKLLLNHGADMNTMGNGSTPLRAAIEHGHEEAAELLKSLGAIDKVLY